MQRPRTLYKVELRGRWLEVENAASRVGSLERKVVGLLLGEHLLSEPRGQPRAIAHCRRVKSQGAPDLGAMIFDRAPVPIVGGKRLCWDLHLLGEVGDHRFRDVVRPTRELGFLLEVLQEHRKPQASRPGFVRQQVPFARPQGKLVNEFVEVPGPLHQLLPLTIPFQAREKCREFTVSVLSWVHEPHKAPIAGQAYWITTQSAILLRTIGTSGMTT